MKRQKLVNSVLRFSCGVFDSRNERFSLCLSSKFRTFCYFYKYIYLKINLQIGVINSKLLSYKLNSHRIVFVKMFIILDFFRMIKSTLFLLLVGVTTASYCGKSGVPYSFEVLPNGAPVLGCAQPSCVAALDDPVVEDSEFLTDVNGQSDGFFREGDRTIKRYRHGSAPKLVANCTGSFSELSCPRKNQFVGGIEYIDHPRQP